LAGLLAVGLLYIIRQRLDAIIGIPLFVVVIAIIFLLPVVVTLHVITPEPSVR
jgi:hypothetical protein